MANLLTYQTLGISSLLIGGAYFYINLQNKRSKNAHFPQLPPSLLMGHLMVFDEFTKRGLVDRHPGMSSLISSSVKFRCLYMVLTMPP